MRIHLPPSTLNPILEARGNQGVDFELLKPSLFNAASAEPLTLLGSARDSDANEQLAAMLASMAVRKPEVVPMVVHRKADPVQVDEQQALRRKKAASWQARQDANLARQIAYFNALPGGELTRRLNGLVEGPGTRAEGIALAEACRANPGGFFLDKEYDSGTLARYMGASNALRGMGLDKKAHWGSAGWELGPKGEGDAYAQRMDTLREWIEKEGIPEGRVREALLAQKAWAEARDKRSELEVVEHLWGTAMAAAGTGDLDLGFGRQGNQEPAWNEIRGLALPMRILTMEQVGMAMPGLSLRAADKALQAWAQEGMLKHHSELAGLLIWQVTERAVRDGITAGLMSAAEGESRLSIRKKQEAHDLAVGDALMFLTAQAAEIGISIQGVETEAGFNRAQAEGLWPDFRLRLDMGPARFNHVVDVEVVGRGGSYRGKVKLQGAQAAGMKLFSAGLDGQGVRHG